MGVTGDVAAGVDEDQLLDASDDVKVWERAGLPFRADTSNAATTVDNTNVFVSIEDQSLSEAPIRKDKLAVYNSDDTVTLDFEDTTLAGTSNFATEDVELLVAKLDADHSILDEDYTGLTVSEAIDLVTVPNANNNATFEMIDAGSLDGSGETSINYDLSASGTNNAMQRGSGQYMFFLVQNNTSASNDANDGFEVDSNGQLSVTGQTQVIGMDAVAVQSTSATASANDAEQGETVTIDVDASGLSDSTPNHTLVVYHEETFENARTEINSPNISRDLEADDIEIEHEISKLNGPVENAQEVTIGGATIGAGSDSGPVSVSTAIDYLVDSAGTERPQNSLLPNPTELDGAVYTYAGQSLNSVTVDTQDDWETGDYRYIYIAGGSDSTELATVSGTFELESDSPTGPPSGGGGGGGGGDGGDDDDDRDDDDDDSDTTPPVDRPDVTKEVDRKNGSVKVSIENPGVNKEFEIDLGTDDEEGDETEANDTGAKVTKLGLNLSKSAEKVNVSVKNLDKRPDDITEDPSDKTVGYVQVDVEGVDDDDDVNSARFTFSVSQERLDEIEAAPEDIVLYRHHDGEWQELETTYLGDGEFEAETPGFSVFAIGTKKQQVTTTTTEPATTTTAEPTTMTDEPTTDEPTTDEPTTTSGTGIPGFGATVSVLALIAVALVALRRD
ncbi:PKD domain containing protein [Haloferax larsenii JCM 13917]|nr:PGF-pre-PGF domain-containing protein [Haloferax larsenii]ELZ77957.1 PKD domain containing protein [Haloferax larsenii JCM 13917]